MGGPAERPVGYGPPGVVVAARHDALRLGAQVAELAELARRLRAHVLQPRAVERHDAAQRLVQEPEEPPLVLQRQHAVAAQRGGPHHRRGEVQEKAGDRA
jgi:hypothetical protein